MKNLFLALFITFPILASCQLDEMVGIEKDSIFQDSSQSWTPAFRITDTTGDVASGNYYVKVQKVDSAKLVSDLYSQIESAYNIVGKSEANKFQMLQKGGLLRQKAVEITGSDLYRQSIGDKIRPKLSGLYAFRYNGLVYRIKSADGLRFSDIQSNLLILTSAPFSETWITFIDRTQEAPEPIQMYKISNDLYIGDGQFGRAILRKLR